MSCCWASSKFPPAISGWARTRRTGFPCRITTCRWPVTVAQFAAFVRASGYKPADPNCLKGITNHPVAFITWHDAMAYCRWLNERLREHAAVCLIGERSLTDAERQFWQGLADGASGVGLPSEAEWEKAARGTEGWIYPWGDEPDPNKANYGDAGLGTTSAVGCFLGGVSPYGCEEMAGNVWEWTRSLYAGYPYPPKVHSVRHVKTRRPPATEYCGAARS